MGLVRHGVGFVSTGLLAASIFLYGGRIKDIDATRVKIDSALSSIEDQPDGAAAITQVTKELEALEKTSYGRRTLKEIHDKLLALEDKSPKEKELGVEHILAEARSDATSKTASDEISLIGAVGLTGTVTATTLIAPLIGGLLVRLLFGEEKDGSVLLKLEDEGEPGEHRKLERLEREAKRRKPEPDEKPTTKEWLRKLLTREVGPKRKIRPQEQAILDEARERAKYHRPR